jgi:uncharacterized lipoprotein YbaY
MPEEFTEEINAGDERGGDGEHPPTAGDGHPMPGLVDRDWAIVAIGGTPITAGTPSLRFDADGRLSGSTGVNRMFAGYRIDGGVLEVGAAGSTLMAGPPEAMEVERRVLDALHVGGPIALTGDELVIGSGDHQLALRAEPVASPEVVDDPVVTGSVFYRERMAMPAGAVLRVSLADVSRADAPSDVLATLEVVDPGNVPIDFELTYDPALIDERHTYAVRATIDVDDRLWWTSTEAHHVLTGGSPATVEIMLTRAGH